MLTVTTGNGGWLEWTTTEDEVTGLVRFEDRNGRLVVAELHLPRVPSARKLARLPVSTLEAWANSPEDSLGEMIRASLPLPGPLLTVAASYFATTWGAPRGEPFRPHWAADMYWSQFSDNDVPPAPLAKGSRRVSATMNGSVDARVERPEQRPYPHEFYEQVAAVYGALAARHRNPNARIADASGVPLSTVERWVRRCRELGLLHSPEWGRRG